MRFKRPQHGIWGAKQSSICPYGHMGQNTGYAMIAQRYGAQYGYDPRALAKIAVDQHQCSNTTRRRCFMASR